MYHENDSSESWENAKISEMIEDQISLYIMKGAIQEGQVFRAFLRVTITRLLGGAYNFCKPSSKLSNFQDDCPICLI